MNTLTVPKIKDLVNKPTQQYQDLYSTMGGSSTSHAQRAPLYGSNEKMEDANHPTMGGSAPLDELTSFLSDLKKNTNNSIGPGSLGPSTSSDKFPSTLGSAGGDMGYSLY